MWTFARNTFKSAYNCFYFLPYLTETCTSYCITLISSYTSIQTIAFSTQWIVKISRSTNGTFTSTKILFTWALPVCYITWRIQYYGSRIVAIAPLTANDWIETESSRSTLVAFISNNMRWASTFTSDLIAVRTVAG